MNGNNMEKMMLIYQTLMRESDEGHKLTLRQIMEDLSKYDMSMSDKTFYNCQILYVIKDLYIDNCTYFFRIYYFWYILTLVMTI